MCLWILVSPLSICFAAMFHTITRTERGRHWCCALIRINKRIFHFDHKTHFAISCHIKHLFRLKVMLFLTYKTSVHSNGRTRTHTLSLHNEIISHRIWNELQVRQRNKPRRYIHSLCLCGAATAQMKITRYLPIAIASNLNHFDVQTM